MNVLSVPSRPRRPWAPRDVPVHFCTGGPGVRLHLPVTPQSQALWLLLPPGLHNDSTTRKVSGPLPGPFCLMSEASDTIPGTSCCLAPTSVRPSDTPLQRLPSPLSAWPQPLVLPQTGAREVDGTGAGQGGPSPVSLLSGQF